MFKYNKNPGTFGKCDSCYMTSVLKVKCKCEKMFYCNELCRKKDERYHKANCEYENKIDSEKLETL